MNKKVKWIVIPILTAIFCISIIFAFAVVDGENKKAAYAEGENFSSTKHMVSVDGNYLSLATAFKLSLIEEGKEYAMGYVITYDESDHDVYSSVYYEGITLKNRGGGYYKLHF